MLVSAGVVLLASASVWLFSSMGKDGDSVSTEETVAPAGTSLPSLEPPSVVILPPAPSIENETRAARAPSPPPSEPARLKRSESKTPMTSPPAFRPREL
jgi:hypothetical protein